MKKIIELDEYFPTGEAIVQPILPWGSGRVDTSRISKHASEALDYIKHVSPEPGKTNLLLLALGASETYGPNRNGDGFPEKPVPARGKVASTKRAWFVPPGEELTKHYQSFEKNPAHAFKHHVNRDPSKASGVVKKAFWNDRMKRVELLAEIDNDKDPEWVQRTNDGEFVPVSMGCFVAGAMVAMADGTEKPIEQIVVGDLVRTHLGRVRAVTEFHRRPYRGTIYTIRAEGHEALRATEEHPFFVTPRESVKAPARTGAKWKWRDDAKVVGAWTHASCLDDQFMLEPIDRTEVSPAYLSRAFARLLGYYLAEGHVIWRNRVPYGVELTTHKDDAVHAEIETLCAEFQTRNAPWTFERKNSAAARGIMIWDERLAALCHAHGGALSKHKQLSTEVMQWPVAMQRELFGAYANGDGCGRDGWLKISTASNALAAQWRRMLPRLGIIPSCNTLTHKAGSGFNTVETYEHVIHIGVQWAWQLAKVCTKVSPREILAKKESRKIVGDYVVTPIREIATEYADVEVYNFEVDEDNSYLVDGIASHNCRIKRDVCSICGNEAPTRADYCEHAKYAMNTILPDGQKVYVHNPSPDFFDISRVFRPADRTGYTLKKVAEAYEVRSSAELGERAEMLAHKGAASQKLSDIIKTIQDRPVATSTLSPDEKSFVVKFRDHAGKKLAAAPAINVDKLAAWPLGEVLSAAAANDIVLRDDEFGRLVTLKMSGQRLAFDGEKFAMAAHAALEVFAENPVLLDELLDEGALESNKVASELMEHFAAAREKRGYAGEYLYRRLVPEGIGVRDDAAPTTDLLHAGPYTTTRGAAIDAQDAVTRSHWKKILGGGALMLGGYKALTAFPWMRRLKLPLAVGAGVLGAKLLGKRPGGEVMTDEGYAIPNITEFTHKQASQTAIASLVEHAFGQTKVASFPRLVLTEKTSLDDVVLQLGLIAIA